MKERKSFWENPFYFFGCRYFSSLPNFGISQALISKTQKGERVRWQVVKVKREQQEQFYAA
jgi:hypothetical protein